MTIEEIIKDGTPEEKIYLYSFNPTSDDKKVILKKFYLFVAGNYPRYFKSKKAPFHDDMVLSFISAYIGEDNINTIGFRGCAKTSIKKLFDVFVLLNDTTHHRRYFKVLTRDITKTGKPIVTDVYNLIDEVRDVYGNQFETIGKRKREETMESFTMSNGIKYAAVSVGQVQRGHSQDDSRPDFLWFEDIEDKESIRSITITQSIMDKCDEAIQGMSVEGSYVLTANYISDQGSVQWFLNKGGGTQIIPIISEEGGLAWERYSHEWIEKKKKEADDWEGDYMCNPVSSDDLFFDRGLVEKALEGIEEPKKVFAGVKVWEEYRADHRYGIGADVSEGIGRDSNALTIFDYQKGEVVGTYHDNKIAPDMFGHLLVSVGRKYGECLLAPELNNVGHATVTAIKEQQYPLVYKAVNTNAFSNETTSRLGWVTTAKTKNTAFFKFKKDWEDGQVRIRDKELLEEMKAFTNMDLTGTARGAVTRHFDLLMAAVIGWSAETQAGFPVTRKLKTRY